MLTKEVVNIIGGIVSKNSATILTGFAVGGLFTTAILTGTAVPKALILIEEEEYSLTKIEKIKLTWKCFIPPVAVGAATIACIIGSNHINLRRNAALASVYSLTDAAFKEYKTKVADTIGQKKERQIRDDICDDRVKEISTGKNEIIFTGKGDVLCYESLNGRTFESDHETIRKVVNDTNARLLHEMFISVNEFYYDLGLKPTRYGDQMGWHIDDGIIEILYSSSLTENNKPCLVLDFLVAPKYR